MEWLCAVASSLKLHGVRPIFHLATGRLRDLLGLAALCGLLGLEWLVVNHSCTALEPT